MIVKLDISVPKNFVAGFKVWGLQNAVQKYKCNSIQAHDLPSCKFLMPGREQYSPVAFAGLSSHLMSIALFHFYLRECE